MYYNIPVPNCAGQLTIDDLRSVQRAIWDARSCWYNIGLKLGLDPDTLGAIRMDKRDNIDNCFTEMLTHWLRQVNPPHTWSALADALRSPTVGYKELLIAEQVESMYVADVSDSGPATEIQEGEFIGSHTVYENFHQFRYLLLLVKILSHHD